MDTVKIVYKWLGILNKKISVNHPSRWNDLERQHLIGFTSILRSYYFLKSKEKQEKLIKETETDRINLVPAFLNFQKNAFWKLSAFQIQELVPLSEWLITSPKCLNKVVIEQIKIRRKRYFAPSNKFNNLSVFEFAYADTFFMNFSKAVAADNDILASTSMNQLIAVLYREERKGYNDLIHADKREDFTLVSLEKRAAQMQKLEINIKEAILFNFVTIRDWFTSLYPFVFPSINQNSEKGNSSDNNNNSSYSYNNFIRDLVDGDYTNEKEILKTPVRTILFDLNIKIKKSQEIEK